MDAMDARILELDQQGIPVREISETLRAEYPGRRGLGKSVIAARLPRLRAAPAPIPLLASVRPQIPPGYAPPLEPGMPPRVIVHEITPETAPLLERYGRAVYEPPLGWTPPAPTWDPETSEPWTLQGVRHDIASNPRLAAGVALAGSVVDAAVYAWFHDDANGLERPDADLVLRALRHPYELARAVANVVEFGEEREDGPAAKGDDVSLEEQLGAGLAILAAAADELRAMAERTRAKQAAKGYRCAFLNACDGWHRSVVEGLGVCEEGDGDDDAPRGEAA